MAEVPPKRHSQKPLAGVLREQSRGASAKGFYMEPNKDLQIENGHYTRIVNPLIEELIKLPFKGCELAVAFHILRMTYGYQKKQDSISLSQFQKALARSRSTIIKALTNLETLNIVVNTRVPYQPNTLKINKYFKTWGVVNTSKIVTRTNGVVNTSRLVNTGIPEVVNTGIPGVVNTGIHTKEIIKEKRNIPKNTHRTEAGTGGVQTTMYNYEFVDEDGNPIKKTKRIGKITKNENDFLIAMGFLWQETIATVTKIEKTDVPLLNVYYPLRKAYDREKFTKADFKELFEHYARDPAIKYEDKIAFDLCLSQKYIAKWKLVRKKKNIAVTPAQMANEIYL